MNAISNTSTGRLMFSVASSSTLTTSLSPVESVAGSGLSQESADSVFIPPSAIVAVYVSEACSTIWMAAMPVRTVPL